MEIRGDVAGVMMDMTPQGTGPSSGGHNYDVGENLSTQFYANLADVLAASERPAITLSRARDVMAVLEAARDSNANGRTVTFSDYTG